MRELGTEVFWLSVEGLRKVGGGDFDGLFLEFGVGDELVEFGFEGGGV